MGHNDMQERIKQRIEEAKRDIYALQVLIGELQRILEEPTITHSPPEEEQAS
jgi:hypothetical protein